MREKMLSRLRKVFRTSSMVSDGRQRVGRGNRRWKCPCLRLTRFSDTAVAQNHAFVDSRADAVVLRLARGQGCWDDVAAGRVPDIVCVLFVLLFAVGDFRRHFCFLVSRLPNDKEILCAVCTQIIRESFAAGDTLKWFRGERSKKRWRRERKIKFTNFRFAF